MAPAEPEVVPLGTLQALAATLPMQPTQPQSTYRNHSKSFDPEAWIVEHDIQVHHTTRWNSGLKYVLSRCLWNDAHTDKASYILRFPNGAIAAGCLHNGCLDKS